MRNAASIFFDKTVDVERLAAVTGEADTQAWGTHTLSIKCSLQPLDDAFGEDLTGSYGKDFLMFTDNRSDIDIIQGDRINDGTNEYIVQGVESYDFEGYKHNEFRIRLTK